MMIEKIILDYLSVKLTVPVYMEYPETTEAAFIVLEKTGSRKSNRIKTATIAIQSVAVSLYKAAELNEQVKNAMENAVILPDIGNVALNSDYNFTDTQTKLYRYQAVYDITHY